ncbi:MAG: DUF309 domain-containing protein [Leptospiraceae bacterium]|nr:DUF309 domain-containing protein [Leptospiraceae bacterium]
MKLHSYLLDENLENILNHIKSFSTSSLTREFAYSKGVEYFNKGMFFESHEILEYQWKKENGNIKIFFQIIIQIAISLHKIHVRPNSTGAYSLASKAGGKIDFLLKENLTAEYKDILKLINDFIISVKQSDEKNLKNIPIPKLIEKLNFSLLEN